MDKKLQQEMSHVYQYNLWGSSESRSGVGSSPLQTMYIEHEVPLLFERLGVESVLDIPCGDFGWMRKALTRTASDITYHGADIVPKIIELNNQHASDQVSFSCLDITSDELPMADLIFTRDCLVHLSDSMILKAFHNIKKSGAKYIAMTHFNWFHIPNKTMNDDEVKGGSWRKINFRMSPFYLPTPIDMISEGSSEDLGKDKTIAVWRVEDLPDCLTLD